ncbi:MAG TPA: sulfite exporter TauE/SafE family protein [bacterium]
MSVIEWVIDIALGAVLGFLGGLFGIGGGVLAIPTLGVFFGFSQQMAQGTAMVTVVPNVYLALWLYRKRHDIPLRLALAVGFASIIFTYLAARVAIGMDSHLLRRCFAAFVFCVATYMVWKAWVLAPPAVPRPAVVSRKWLPSLGAITGIVGGLFGVGGGILTPPLMTGLFGMKQLEAQGWTLALVAPGATAALLTYGHAGEVHWRTGVLLAVGGFAAISPGVALAHKLPERLLRGAFGVFLWFAAAGLFLTSLR